MARHVVNREVADDDLHAVHTGFQKRRDVHGERRAPDRTGPLIIHIDNRCLPNRRFQPRLHSKAKIAPGPNNPVGLVWIDISKEHYGLHGTPEPSLIGHTTSHGCVRLTNWDAWRLASLVKTGTPVIFEP